MEDFSEKLGEAWNITWVMTLCVIGYSAVWFIYLTSGIAITPNPKSGESFEKQMRWE